MKKKIKLKLQQQPEKETIKKKPKNIIDKKKTTQKGKFCYEIAWSR